MKRKRVVQWVIVNRFGEVTHCYDTKAECEEVLRGSGEPRRIVRLVEHDAAREAVVRAAVKWYRRRLPFDLDVLDEAVERMKGRKK